MTKKVQIGNDLGLHLRAAGILAHAATAFACDIWLEHNKIRANAKSIMSLLALGATKGTQLTLITEGADAEAALESIGALIERGFAEA